ncbi:ParA family protein [Deinococcus ruber]|nr:ParA family protein [Deinococcus ruber]
MSAPSGPMIVSLTSMKGGVGKSTLAVNLAGALAMRGPTALMDADAAIQTSGGWIARGAIPVTLLEEGAAIPAGTRYLVVDTEGRPEIDDMVELTRQSHVVLIPTAPNSVEVEATAKLLRRLEDAGANMKTIRIVVTKAPPVGSVGQAARDELRAMGMPVCETVIRRYTAHERAHEQAVLVRNTQDSRAENAWGDILSLTVEVC